MEHLKDSYEWLKETNKIGSQIRSVSDNLRLINTKNNIKFKEIPIDHFRREAGEAGFKLKHLIGIIVRNIIGLIKIKID